MNSFREEFSLFTIHDIITKFLFSLDADISKKNWFKLGLMFGLRLESLI